MISLIIKTLDSADTRRKACLRLEEVSGGGGDSTGTRRKACLRLEEEGGGGSGSAATQLLGHSATRLLGGRLEEEGGEVVGGGATEIGGDGLGRKESLYFSRGVAEADHLDGQLFGGGVEKEIAGEIEAGDQAAVHTDVGLYGAAGEFGLAAEIGFVGVTIDEIPGGELLVGLLPDLGDLLGGKGHLAVTC